MSKSTTTSYLYHWQGIDASKQRVKGVLRAENQNQAIIKLKKENLKIIKIHRQSKFHLNVTSSKITSAEITLFTCQLSTTISCGIPLTQSLQLLSAHQKNDRFKALIMQIIGHIESGHSLSDALRLGDEHFDSFYIQLVAIGEMTGALQPIFQRLADLRENQQKMRQKAIKAMIYPSVIIITAIFITAIILTTIIPEFAQLFKSVNAELPLYTQYLILISNWLKNHIITLCLLLISAISLFIFALHKFPAFNLWFSQQTTKLPLLGVIIQKCALLSFSYGLSLTLSSGIPILTALKNVSLNINNRYYQHIMTVIYQDISRGTTLHSALQKQGDLPDYFLQMVMVGEQSGTLDTMLSRVASQYEHEVDDTIDNLHKILEPSIMILLGLIIGTLIVSIYLPIFNLMTVMG